MTLQANLCVKLLVEYESKVPFICRVEVKTVIFSHWKGLQKSHRNRGGWCKFCCKHFQQWTLPLVTVTGISSINIWMTSSQYRQASNGRIFKKQQHSGGFYDRVILFGTDLTVYLNNCLLNGARHSRNSIRLRENVLVQEAICTAHLGRNMVQPPAGQPWMGWWTDKQSVEELAPCFWLANSKQAELPGVWSLLQQKTKTFDVLGDDRQGQLWVIRGNAVASSLMLWACLYHTLRATWVTCTFVNEKFIAKGTMRLPCNFPLLGQVGIAKHENT